MNIDMENMELASAGTRLVSYIIDGIVVGVIGSILNYVALNSGEVVGQIARILSVLISMVYFTYFFGNGQTPGMTVMKIKLCGTDGMYPIGYGKGFLRWVGMIISGLVLLLGYIWILIDKKNQGWHDKIAGTYVIKE